MRTSDQQEVLAFYLNEAMRDVIPCKVDFLCIEHCLKQVLYHRELLSNTGEDFPGGMADKVKAVALAHYFQCAESLYCSYALIFFFF